MERVLGPLLAVLFFAYGIAQIVAGFIGIDAAIGTFWAGALLFLAFVFRFMLPLTIGAFWCAFKVWHWHWALAVIFAAPGLLFLIPGIALQIGEWWTTAKERREERRNAP